MLPGFFHMTEDCSSPVVCCIIDSYAEEKNRQWFWFQPV